MLQTCLFIGALIIAMGILRLVAHPPRDLGDLLMRLFLLDWLGDILGAVGDGLGDLGDGDSDGDSD